MNYLLTAAVQKVQQIQENGCIENETSITNEMFQYCCVLGRLMFKKCGEDHHQNEQLQDVSFMLKCTEVLSLIINAVIEKFPDKVLKFVDAISMWDFHDIKWMWEEDSCRSRT